MGITESLGEKRAGLRETTSSKPSKSKKNSKGWFSLAVATGFGVGFLPLAPGTWGSALAVLLLAIVYRSPVSNPFLIHLGLTVIFLLLALSTGTRAALRLKQSDPAPIVMDEMAGQALCLLFVPFTVVSMIIGFVLFRVLDILKPFPARRSENLPGGVGILMDDVIAGLYAGGILWVVYGMV